MRFETRSIMTVIGWWGGLPWWLRYTVAGGLMLASTLIYLLTDTLWVWGWVVGAILFAFGGRSDAEKKGYNF